MKKKKSAEQQLIEHLEGLIDEAYRTLPPDEFERRGREFDALIRKIENRVGHKVPQRSGRQG